MRCLTIGGLTLDDIVTSNGDVYPNVPGGNALYAALGARLWMDQVGMLTFAGADYPTDVLDRVAAAGVDVSHVRSLPVPSIHLWMLYEPDGRRQIAYQHRSSHLSRLGAVAAEEIPRIARELVADGAIHLAALPVSLQEPLLALLRPLGRQLTLDSIEARGTVGGDLTDYWRGSMFGGVAAFLPSQEEFEALRGPLGTTEAIRALGAAGLPVIVIKQGERGVVIHARAGGEWQIPAFDTIAIDPTGAGDAFCGGFMAGLLETGDPVEAGLRGVVSASFTIEAIGGLQLLGVSRSEAEVRLAALRSRSPFERVAAVS